MFHSGLTYDIQVLIQYDKQKYLFGENSKYLR